MATDDFNRADNSDLGANWTPITGLSNLIISSNEARANATLTDCAERWNVEAFDDDQFSECVVVDIGADAGIGAGPAVRMASGSTDFYFVMCNDTNIELWINDAGTSFSLVVDAGAVTPGAVVRLECEGTALRVYEDEVERISTTDGTHTGGYVGLFGIALSATTETRMDNWRGGNLSDLGANPLLLLAKDMTGNTVDIKDMRG